jgi:branched-chain amino acid aminotransferase
VTDAILLDENGYMLETMTANFYAILDGVLYTAGEGMLHGISRMIVLEVAEGVLPIIHQALHIDQLLRISEAFFSSSSRGIVPINRIDEREFSDFSITYDLMRRYDAWVMAHLQEL